MLEQKYKLQPNSTLRTATVKSLAERQHQPKSQIHILCLWKVMEMTRYRISPCDHIRDWQDLQKESNEAVTAKPDRIRQRLIHSANSHLENANFIIWLKWEHPVLLRPDSGLGAIAHLLQKQEFCFQDAVGQSPSPSSTRLTAVFRMCQPSKINTATSEESMSFTRPWQHWAARSKEL